MSVLTVYGNNFADTFNPNIFGTNFTDYIIFGLDGDDVITVTDNIRTEIYGGEGNDILQLFDADDFASGGIGDDMISSGAGDDTVHGDDGNDTIDGGLGNDTIYGGDGNDFIAGGRGDDYISGGSGNDIVNAGNGADTVYGGNGNDVLNGAGGNDHLDGGRGNDTIDGGSGDDFIYGNKGSNTLFGGAGNDTVNTGDHTSSADGGTGDDLIVARLKKGGDHTLTGGEGADTFEFQYQTSRKSADVVITDFELGLDDFIINGLNGDAWVDSNFAFAEVFGLDLLTEVNGNAVLDFGANDTITFEGVSEADFMAYYFDEIAIG